MLKTVRLSLHPVTFCLRHSLFGCLEATFLEGSGTPEYVINTTIKYVINRNTHRHTVKTVSQHHRNLILHRSCSCLSICKAWKTFVLWLQRCHRLRNVCADSEMHSFACASVGFSCIVESVITTSF